jgi:hypothetical protein
MRIYGESLLLADETIKARVRKLKEIGFEWGKTRSKGTARSEGTARSKAASEKRCVSMMLI